MNMQSDTEQRAVEAAAPVDCVACASSHPLRETGAFLSSFDEFESLMAVLGYRRPVPPGH